MRAAVVCRAFGTPRRSDENGDIRRLALGSGDKRNGVADVAVDHAHAVRHAAGKRRRDQERA
ncbi:MAG: hypothetical protein FD172_2032 [Methylocystaceae bacterium]|nr:MAG: hypothetical protein FD172_2032 [Methylocystaceae bacterium]